MGAVLLAAVSAESSTGEKEDSMIEFWEVKIYACLTALLGLWLGLRVLFLWLGERKHAHKRVAVYCWKPSTAAYRANVRVGRA